MPGWTIRPLEAEDWPEETGETYVENARLKAEFGQTLVDGVDDRRGLRHRGGGARRPAGAAFVPLAPEGAPVDREAPRRARRRRATGARATCRSSWRSRPVARSFAARGVLEGRIASAPRGSEGFGYDPVFVPDGEERTVAELGDVWKAHHSHRARVGAGVTPSARAWAGSVCCERRCSCHQLISAPNTITFAIR